MSLEDEDGGVQGTGVSQGGHTQHESWRRQLRKKFFDPILASSPRPSAAHEAATSHKRPHTHTHRRATLLNAQATVARNANLKRAINQSWFGQANQLFPRRLTPQTPEHLGGGGGVPEASRSVGFLAGETGKRRTRERGDEEKLEKGRERGVGVREGEEEQRNRTKNTTQTQEEKEKDDKARKQKKERKKEREHSARSVTLHCAGPILRRRICSVYGGQFRMSLCCFSLLVEFDPPHFLHKKKMRTANRSTTFIPIHSIDRHHLFYSTSPILLIVNIFLLHVSHSSRHHLSTPRLPFCSSSSSFYSRLPNRYPDSSHRHHLSTPRLPQHFPSVPSQQTPRGTNNITPFRVFAFFNRPLDEPQSPGDASSLPRAAGTVLARPLPPVSET
ncbi:hypothetical protein C7M84_003022 [Penaeus vannamei]|uniref:Uncharacterized protein n=1 Tax=Penaeus vannamei TaxID=6689 RepID=A0A3R7MJD6_PENVA|nr:hypothetical protein C7M84_003022 [Penaeus vannamei]